MLLAVVNLLLSFTEGITLWLCIYLFMKHNRRKIFRRRFWYVLGFSAAGIGFYALTFWMNRIGAVWIPVIFYFCAVPLLGRSLFHKRSWSLLFDVIFSVLLFFGMEIGIFFMNLLFAFYRGRNLLLIVDLILALKIMLSLVITAVSIRLIGRLQEGRLKGKQTAGMFLLPVFSVVFVVSMLRMNMVYGQLYSNALLLINLILLVLVNCYFIFLFRYMFQSNQLEQELERRMANIESEFPGYDEYQYDVDTIGHDPNELISYLTAKFNAFTPAQVQAELEALFNQQYTLTTREEVQIRYRTVTWTDEEGNEHESEEAYEYYILHVTLRNHSLGRVAVENLTEDEKGRYAAILELKGNKPYLFGDNIYANPSEGEHYEIPGEALSDPSFAALITEAEKYLGYPYVWGGSNPSTSFDCSGFVCWVFTNSGVHNLPRTTAQGIYNQCAIISSSEAKPGDIIFFTGTYDSAGPVSHVGIYVGDGMMIHCGSPIQYANINTSYWQQHFYAFGRL